MDCADEVATIRRALEPLLTGGGELHFDVVSGILTVRGGEVAPPRLLEAIASTGMRAEVATDRPGGGESGSMMDDRARFWAMLLGGLLTLTGFIVHATLRGDIAAALGGEGSASTLDIPWIAKLFYSIAIAVSIRPVIRKAWLAARQLRPDMNLLMCIAVLGAVAIGEWFEAATVAFLFALSVWLEAWSVGRARRAIGTLLDLSPPTARTRVGDVDSLLPVEQIPAGSLVLVEPGERIPLDGTVEGGVTEIDQSSITGESALVPKQPGSEVFAGTVNGVGAIEIRTSRAASDTTLARIVRMVRGSHESRARSERWVDGFARRYTPAVLVASLLLCIAPPLLGAGAWADWFYRALVLLVIACPCALVISTPVAVVSALTAAARAGVLIKGGEFVEAPAQLDAIAFDKTGTVTQGKLRVDRIVGLAGHSESEVLITAAALESRSSHPLARAIVTQAAERGLSHTAAERITILPGRGATGDIEGRSFWIGSHRLLEERGLENPHVHDELEALTAEGNTVVVVGEAAHACGFIALRDTPRPEAATVMTSLRSLGVRHLALLTGDNRGTASALSRTVRFDDVRAELLPEDKVAAIRDLRERHGRVAMVGDGVNDAPALAEATLSIAMGAGGSDAAIETADIALMSDDLSRIPWLIRHSRRTLTLIRQNIALSLITKAAFLVLALFGHASLWAAIAADMGTSVVVILNAMRLLRAPALPTSTG